MAIIHVCRRGANFLDVILLSLWSVICRWHILLPDFPATFLYFLYFSIFPVINEFPVRNNPIVIIINHTTKMKTIATAHLSWQFKKIESDYLMYSLWRGTIYFISIKPYNKYVNIYASVLTVFQYLIINS